MCSDSHSNATGRPVEHEAPYVLFDQLHAGGMHLVAATVAGLALFLPKVSAKM
jgi:hypothetical protein